MGVFQNHLMAAAVAKAAESTDFYDHQIGTSCRMVMSDGSRIRRTPGSDGNRQTWSISMWVKRSKVGDEQFLFEAGASGGAGSRLRLVINDDDKILITTGDANLVTGTRVLRDVSAWYHVHWKNTGGTNTVHINGVAETSVSIAGDTAINSTVAHGLGCRGGSGDDTTSSWDGYIAEAVLTDGTAYSATDLAEDKNGVWIPKDPSGLTFGDNGFWLNFASSGDMGNDVSGNNNDYTTSNISAHDQMKDCVTFDGSSNGGNFCTLNPLGQQGGGTESGTCTEGNLLTAAADYGQIATFGLTAAQGGKWYWEAYCPTSSPSGLELGISNDMCNSSTAFGYNTPGSGPGADHIGYYGRDNDGTLHSGITDGTHAVAPYGPDYNSGEIVGIAVDVDNGKIWFSNGEDGTSGNPDWITGDPADGSSPARGSGGSVTTTLDFTKTWYPSFGNWSGSSRAMHFNFGQDSSFSGTKTGSEGAADGNGYGDFYYNPPSGFVALCAANLTTPAADPAEDEGPENYFKVLTYAGGTTGHVTGFQPDFVWTKRYTDGQSNGVWDSTRGTTKILNTDSNAAEGTSSGLTAFNSDGYDMGTYYNQSGDSYVSWSWKANAGTTSSNTEGGITSTVQTDADRGFSLITYTGTGSGNDMGHGLGVVPATWFLKRRNSTANWGVYHKDIASDPSQAFLKLDNNEAAQTGAGAYYWNSTMPTSSVLSVGSTSDTNHSGGTFVIYAFASKEGYSSFGSYEGNGNANGTYVCTGFRPAWIMTKSVDSTSDWQIFDENRLGYNVDNNELQANEADAQTTTDMIDILSNGFKLRITSDPNVAETYVYWAFARNPFKYAVAR